LSYDRAVMEIPLVPATREIIEQLTAFTHAGPPLQRGRDSFVVQNGRTQYVAAVQKHCGEKTSVGVYDTAAR
jgi:hypothetical protein